MRKLTRTEGNILVKLIYRETKVSTYKLLKQYRGSLNVLCFGNYGLRFTIMI